MNVTPEMVRAEMDYRLADALSGTRLEHVRETRRLRGSRWRRLFQHSDVPADRINEARFAA